MYVKIWMKLSSQWCENGLHFFKFMEDICGCQIFSKDLLAFPPLFSFFEEALDDDVHNLKKLLIMLGDIYMVVECFAQMKFYFFHPPFHPP